MLIQLTVKQPSFTYQKLLYMITFCVYIVEALQATEASVHGSNPACCTYSGPEGQQGLFTCIVQYCKITGKRGLLHPEAKIHKLHKLPTAGIRLQVVIFFCEDSDKRTHFISFPETVKPDICCNIR